MQAFRPASRPTLIPTYHSSLIGLCDVARLSAGLGVYESGAVGSLADYAQALRDLNVPNNIVERQLSVWTTLGSYVTERKIPLTLWDKPFEFEAQISRDKDYARGALQTEFGRETFEKVWNDRQLRSLVYADLDEARRSAGAEERRDIETTATWYNFAYRSAQARQNRCDSIEVKVSHLCRPYNESELPIGESLREVKSKEKFKVPAQFLRSVGNLPRSEFEQLISGRIRDLVNGWRSDRVANPDAARDALMSAMELLVDSVQRLVPFHDPDNQESGILKAVTTISAGAGSAFALEYLDALQGRNAIATMLTRRKLISMTAKGAVGATFGFAVADVVGHAFDPENKNKQVVESIVRMQEARWPL